MIFQGFSGSDVITVTMTTYNYVTRRLSPSEVLADLMQQRGANVRIHVSIVQSLKSLSTALSCVLPDLLVLQPILRMRIESDCDQKKKQHVTKRFVEMEEFEPELYVEEKVSISFPLNIKRTVTTEDNSARFTQFRYISAQAEVTFTKN